MRAPRRPCSPSTSRPSTTPWPRSKPPAAARSPPERPSPAWARTPTSRTLRATCSASGRPGRSPRAAGAPKPALRTEAGTADGAAAIPPGGLHQVTSDKTNFLGGGAMAQVLIVANQTLGGEDLLAFVRDRLADDPPDFVLLVPATPRAHRNLDTRVAGINVPLDTEDDDYAEARKR